MAAAKNARSQRRKINDVAADVTNAVETIDHPHRQESQGLISTLRVLGGCRVVMLEAERTAACGDSAFSNEISKIASE